MENEQSNSSRKRLRSSKTPMTSECSSSDDETICLDDLLPSHLDELSCPICRKIIENAFVTECGHTFCFKCINNSMDGARFCPKCGFAILRVYPNFLINQLIKVRERSTGEQENNSSVVPTSADCNKSQDEWYQLVSEKTQNLDLDDVDYLLEILQEKKKRHVKISKAIKIELLREFLKQIHIRKQKNYNRLADELKVITEDFSLLSQIESSVVDKKNIQQTNDSQSSETSLASSSITPSPSPSTTLSTTPSDSPSFSPLLLSSQQNLNKVEVDLESIPKSTIKYDPEKINTKLDKLMSQLDERKDKMKLLYDDLEDCYLNLRFETIMVDRPPLLSSKMPSTSADSVSKNKISFGGLNEFMDTLCMTTLYTKFKLLTTISYSDDPSNPSNLVSSIGFDKDNEILAIGGVTKIIKLWEYELLLQKESIAIHYPTAELHNQSKISSLRWSPYYKSLLMSGDYEGTVSIWDTFTRQQINSFHEHSKRCWSVDFNRIDTNLIASGSDDATVKLWSLNMDNSILTLKGSSANVCGVSFNPTSRYHIAFSSADNCIYYYDLRYSTKPQTILRGHQKAVSYVSFTNSYELVSSSTDSSCKLWDLQNSQGCVRTFIGHSNNNKFVGLATDNQYICCGSEHNTIYIYYKGFSKPVLTYSFDFDRPIASCDSELGHMKKNLCETAISAICWKPESNIILAGNSDGIVKIMEMV